MSYYIWCLFVQILVLFYITLYIDLTRLSITFSFSLFATLSLSLFLFFFNIFFDTFLTLFVILLSVIALSYKTMLSVDTIEQDYK